MDFARINTIPNGKPGQVVLLCQLLYAIPPSDPVTYAIALGALIVVSAGAAYVPTWRASRLDPMIALRPE